MKSHSPSVCPSVRPSLTNISRNWIISFRYFLKKVGVPNLGSTALNQAQNEVFYNFLEFGSYVFLEITYDIT